MRSPRIGVAAAALAGALFVAAPGSMEAQRFRFTRLGLDDGLSQGSVNALAQDSEGFLWVGTQNGLNRHDGRSFRFDWRTAGQPSPVSFGSIRSLFVDPAGGLWVGVDSHGLYRFERRREEFVPVPIAAEDGSSREPERVWDFAVLGGRVVIATSEGLARIDSVGAAPVAWPLPNVPAGCGGAVSSLWAASPTELWVGTPRGCLLRLSAGGAGRVELLGELGGVVRTITREAGGGVWVTVEPGGAFRFHRAGDLIAAPAVESRATSEARDILTNSDGETWIATPGGLGWVPTVTGDTTWFTTGPAENGDLPHEFVLALFEDRQGVIWVGTWNGLARVGPFRRGLGFIPTPSTPSRPALGGAAAIQAVDSDHLRLGMIGGGLMVVSLDDAEARREEHAGAGDIYSMATGRDGDLWVATAAGGVIRRTERGWRTYRAGRMGPGGAFDELMPAITVDRTGSVWVGSLNSGLGRYDPATDRIVAFRPPGPDTAYAAPYVWAIVEDGDGALWMGANAPGGGIHRLSPDRTTFTTFITGTPERPNAGRVLTVFPASDGIIWFGTQGGGLGRLDPKSSSVRIYTDADGLPHNNVAGVLEDGTGKLWISTNVGLARFDPVTERFWVFRERGAIEGRQFYANATLELEDGRLLFGGPNGVTVIDPEHIAPRDAPPSVALTRFSVRGSERMDINHVTAQEGVELGPMENFFTIEFAALDFTDASLNAYRYTLENLDPDWIEAADANAASYTGVQPGRYTFRVQARNSEGVWNRAGLTIPIHVRPPYYATWWFRLGVAGVVASLLWAAYSARRDQLGRVRAMRLQITGELHNDIGADLSAIALRSQLLQQTPGMPPGDLQDRLADIETLARKTTQKVREMIWVVKEEHDKIPDLVQRIDDAAKSLLGGVIEYTFRVDPDLPERAIAMEARRDVYEVFKEMIQNVLKHARASHASIELGYDRGHLLISVADNGVGFVASSRATGNGLTHIRRQAEKHGGVFELETAPGMGTRATLRVLIR